jgi:hypothetical protein
MPETKMMLAVRDKGALGNYKRYIIGTKHSNISGALYLNPDMEIPNSLILTFKEDEKETK